jgi:hypothetical protein
MRHHNYEEGTRRREEWMRRREAKMRRYADPAERRRGKMIGGLVLAFLGSLYLLRELDILPFFSLHTIWPFALIGVGLMIALKNRFRNHAWWILIFIGVVNLVDDFPIIKEKNIYASDLVWPAGIIIAGLLIAFRPHRRKYDDCPPFVTPRFTSEASDVNIEVVFGGRKEIVTSKTFKGGHITSTFGGCELNLMQADNTEAMELDLRVTFGGVEIIAPSHWEVQIEIAPTMGSIEDHRSVRTPNPGEERRVLILRGSVTFGSVEIKSY